jgi:small GTP-binding protein
MLTDHPSPKYKVVFVGDPQVGKTSLIRRYLHDTTAVISTSGATVTQVEVNLPSHPITLIVWDTAGQEDLRNLVPVYAKGSHAAIIAFDQSRPETWKHVDGWFNYILQNVGEIIITIAANKSDIEPSRVDYNEVLQWAAAHGVDVTRTSAHDGTNVDALFQFIAAELDAHAKVAMEVGTSPPPPPVVQIDPEPVRQPEKTNECCI